MIEPQKEQRKRNAREFTKKALNCIKESNQKFDIKDIVYLEDDKYTYKYFMTGKYNGEERDNEIRYQKQLV